MKQFVLNISQKNAVRASIDSVLSFQPFAEYISDKLAKEQTIKQKIYGFVMEKLKQLPSLDKPIDIQDTGNYAELFELIYAALTGITTEDEEKLWALGVPFTPIIYYGTDDLYELMVDKATGEINSYMVKDITENEKRRLALIYSIILQRFYGYTLVFKKDVLHYYTDPECGLYKFYSVHINDSFIKITTKGKLPLLNFRKLEKHIQNFTFTDYLQKVLPLNLFTFTGFSVIHLTNITEQYVIENIKNSILETAIKPKETCVADIKHSLKTLVGSKDIEFGFIPLALLNKKPLLEFGTLSNSILLNYGRSGIIPEQTFVSLVDDYIKKPISIFLKDIKKYRTSTDPLISMLRKSGNASFALIPLFVNNQLTGVLEVYTAKENILDESKLLKLDAALPDLAQLIKASVDDFHQKIANIVNEKFTALQPSVQWKFNESAWHYMLNKLSARKEPELDTIIFKDVYPLYGAIDIRNSSVERNNAAREDIMYWLELLIQTFNRLKQNHQLALIDEMIFKTKKWISNVKESLTTAEEYRLTNFLETEVMPLLQHLKKIKPGSAIIVDEFIEALDEKTGKAYENRRNLETSMQLINRAIINYLDLMKAELQEIYPCYFEKFRTDGVEYDIYIGQSIAPDMPFDVLYLRNLRLWQLKSMVAIYKMVEGLQHEMPRPLRITQLIYINADTIDISFRNDEKRFDVEGSYNIRYQVIKKRIDKVHLKGTSERLTQPGKIALVYFNNKEAEEYASYINFLQEQNILEDNLEYLELEELQGVHGLKALRVGVLTD